MSLQLEVCVVTQARCWSWISVKDTLGAWTSPSVGKCTRQTPSPFPTTSGTKLSSPILYQMVASALPTTNRNRLTDREALCRCSCVLESFSDTGTVTVTPHIKDVGMDTCYSCKSKQTLEDVLVNQTLWNVLIQAFVSNNSKSEVRKCRCGAIFHPALTFSLLFTLLVLSLDTVTVCSADVPSTTAAPTTHATSTTTVAPVTNTTATAPPSTTTPTPTLPTPTIGNYSIKPDENSTACLLAHFGLRIGLKQGDVGS